MFNLGIVGYQAVENGVRGLSLVVVWEGVDFTVMRHYTSGLLLASPGTAQLRKMMDFLLDTVETVMGVGEALLAPYDYN